MSKKLSLYSEAAILLGQQSDLYNNSFTDCSFAFEFVALNVNASYTVDPLFEAPDTNPGFPIVDAVGILDVSAVNFSRMFYFKTNDLETIQTAPSQPGTTEYGITNTSYGVIGNASLDVTTGVNPFDFTSHSNMSYRFSNASIRAGYANPALSFADNTLLHQDYVRYTAKSITGGYALSDIFSNEQELLRGVRNLDESFNSKFSDLLNSANNCEANNASIDANSSTLDYYNFVKSSKSLVDNLFKDANSSNVSSSSFLRGKRFLEDLAAQSLVQEQSNFNFSNLALDGTGDPNSSVNFSGSNTNIYWVIFHPGDVMAVRLNYQPKNGSGNNASNQFGTLGGNPINDRSYKIYLKMV